MNWHNNFDEAIHRETGWGLRNHFANALMYGGFEPSAVVGHISILCDDPPHRLSQLHILNEVNAADFTDFGLWLTHQIVT